MRTLGLRKVHPGSRHLARRIQAALPGDPFPLRGRPAGRKPGYPSGIGGKPPGKHCHRSLPRRIHHQVLRPFPFGMRRTAAHPVCPAGHSRLSYLRKAHGDDLPGTDYPECGPVARRLQDPVSRHHGYGPAEPGQAFGTLPFARLHASHGRRRDRFPGGPDRRTKENQAQIFPDCGGPRYRQGEFPARESPRRWMPH